MPTVNVNSVLRTVVLVAAAVDARDWISPEFRWLYTQPLPIPPVKQEKWPGQEFHHNVTGASIKYYEMNEVEFEQQIYPSLPATKMRGYDGMVPGPTYIEKREIESVVRITNHLSVNSSTHLHGSFSRAPWDGWADDRSQPGQFKDYYYPNGQDARTQWYHDHAAHLTAENVYLGLSGFHILQDDHEQSLNLPGPYGVYDIPLAITSRQYDSNGQIVFPRGETDEIPGDIIHVNGAPWPYLKVEPRKYRFRFLNGALTRTFLLHFDRDFLHLSHINFDIIASDSGLFTSPQQSDTVYISNGERYEVVIDFSPYKGENITLSNTKGQEGEDFLHTDKIMRFMVAHDVQEADNSGVPQQLNAVDFPSQQSAQDRSFTFAKTNNLWTINGVSWDDVRSRILANPIRGSVETWELINDSDEIHPVHVHLVDFQIIKREGGRNTVFNYESAGLKDTVWLGPGEKITVRAYFGPWPGVYMFHCHNLAHEDHAMLVAFNVSILEEYGYHDEAFCDPSDPEWAPKWWDEQAFTYESVDAKVDELTNRTPYYEYNTTNGRDEDSGDENSSSGNKEENQDSDDGQGEGSHEDPTTTPPTKISTYPGPRPTWSSIHSGWGWGNNHGCNTA